MGNITILVSDEIEYKVRQHIFDRYKGRGRYLGSYISVALEVALKRCEEDKEFEKKFWQQVEERKKG